MYCEGKGLPLKTRFLTIQALETTRCLEENILMTPYEADVGSILGWAFVYTGGCLSYIESIGCKSFINSCKELEQTHGVRFTPSKRLLEMSENNIDTFY